MKTGWMHVAEFEGQEKFAPKTLVEAVFTEENKNLIQLLDEFKNINSEESKAYTDNKIDDTIRSALKYRAEIIGKCEFDENELFSVRIAADNEKGYILWIDDNHSVYDIKCSGSDLVICSNADIEGKALNILEIRHSELLVFIGKAEKQENMLIPTNEANREKLIDWVYTGGSITYKPDRVEARTNNNARNMLATKPIDLSQYSRVRIYGKLFTENGNSMYYVYFGVIKSEVIANPPSTNPNQAFYASRRLAGIDGYIELDISQINGMYSVGTYGIGDYDIYKFELLR